MVYVVTTDRFEGPFEILYRLITSYEVDVHEISLSKIVSDFVGYIANLEKFDLETATEFAVIAATLIEIKSRRLLPGKDELLDEEALMFLEERDLLLSRLVDSKTFQDVSKVLMEMLEIASRGIPRVVMLDQSLKRLDNNLLENVKPEDLAIAIVKLRRNAVEPRKVSLEHVTSEPTISVESAFTTMHERLMTEKVLTFRTFTNDLDQRIDVVVYFLALLELYKNGIIDIEQANTFGDLTMRIIENPMDRFWERLS